jgi:hypothetical protein
LIDVQGRKPSPRDMSVSRVSATFLPPSIFDFPHGESGPAQNSKA